MACWAHNQSAGCAWIARLETPQNIKQTEKHCSKQTYSKALWCCSCDAMRSFLHSEWHYPNNCATRLSELRANWQPLLLSGTMRLKRHSNKVAKLTCNTRLTSGCTGQLVAGLHAYQSQPVKYQVPDYARAGWFTTPLLRARMSCINTLQHHLH
jgi:hypothetical protein